MKEGLEGAKGDSGQEMEEKSQRSKTGRPTAGENLGNLPTATSSGHVTFRHQDIGC